MLNGRTTLKTQKLTHNNIICKWRLYFLSILLSKLPYYWRREFNGTFWRWSMNWILEQQNDSADDSSIQLQNTLPLICMSLNKNSIYCVMLRSSKNADQRKQWWYRVAGYSAVAPNVHAILDVNRSTTVWHKIFAGSKFGDFCSFSSDPQKEVPANKKLPQTFSVQNFIPEWIFSNLNLWHKNTVLRNRACSITTCLFHSETTTHWYITWKYVFLFHVLNKNQNNIINTGYWVLSENRKS